MTKQRQMSMATRRELIEAVGARYRAASRGEKQTILDEFVALTGCHRKHAIRTLGRRPGESQGKAARSRMYDEATSQAIILLWEAADRVCGKRLKALMPMLIDAMERHGHLDLDPIIKEKVLAISAATIDRLLAGIRTQIDGQRKRRKGIGAAIRRSIPVRTFADWRDPPPGFFEMDMVEHYSGPKTDGDYLHTLVLTDIASGWTECVSMRHRSQALVIDGLDKIAGDLPFPMLGVDSDNDSAFMTQDVFDYCKAHRLEQTRSRAYKKNDQAWVEQKNGAIVRRLVGYGRLSGSEATKALARLYASARLYINFFQPSFKLKSKTRDGARVKKLYHSPVSTVVDFRRKVAATVTMRGRVAVSRAGGSLAQRTLDAPRETRWGMAVGERVTPDRHVERGTSRRQITPPDFRGFTQPATGAPGSRPAAANDAGHRRGYLRRCPRLRRRLARVVIGLSKGLPAVPSRGVECRTGAFSAVGLSPNVGTQRSNVPKCRQRANVAMRLA